MGLERGNLQRVFDLGGVVAVVSVAAHAVGNAGQLKSPVCADEVCQAFGHFRHVQPPDVCGTDNGQRVQHVGLAGHVQVEIAQSLALQRGSEGGAAMRVIAQVHRAQHALLAQAVGHGMTGGVFAYPTRPEIIAPGDAPARLGHQRREFRKGVLDVVDVLVVVQVILIHVQDYGDGRLELQEAGVILAGFADEVVMVAAGPCGTADEVQLASDVDGGVEPGL